MNKEFLDYYNLPRKAQTHKGDYGKVFVIAGSEGMTGAAMMCAEAALNAGAGLVYIFSPGKLLPIYEIGCREAVKIKVGSDQDAFFYQNHVAQIKSTIIANKDNCTIVIGPGLGQNQATKIFIREIINEIQGLRVPIILDADGLNAYKGREKPKGVIMTPHVGEFSRITGFETEYINKHREEVAALAAEKFESIIVLKGNRSVVASKNEMYVNETGNPGMATGGSGDVLAGIIAALVASSKAYEEEKSLYELVCIGVHIHGLCGDIGAKRYGERALTAKDLIKILKEVYLYGNNI